MTLSAGGELDHQDSDGVRAAIHKALNQLSQAERRLANYTLQHYSSCALMNIGDLAEACDVSTATVNRYAQAVGFRGYLAYRNALRAEATQSSLGLLQDSVRVEGSGHPSIESLERDLANLGELRQTLTLDLVDRTVDTLLSSRRVFVLGQGSSTYIAGYFAFNLQGIGIDARELSTPSGFEGIARTLIGVDERDLVVPIAFPRFTKLTMEVAAEARAQKCKMVSITSSLVNDLAQLSDVVLLAPPRVELHSGSAVTSMATIDALLLALSVKGEMSKESAQRLGDMVDAHVL